MLGIPSMSLVKLDPIQDIQSKTYHPQKTDWQQENANADMDNTSRMRAKNLQNANVKLGAAKIINVPNSIYCALEFCLWYRLQK